MKGIKGSPVPKWLSESGMVFGQQLGASHLSPPERLRDRR